MRNLILVFTPLQSTDIQLDIIITEERKEREMPSPRGLKPLKLFMEKK
jgi:hypothetical protein